MQLTFKYEDFKKVYSGCVNAIEKNGHRPLLEYMELRASNGHCVATALNGFVLWQTCVPCEGEGVLVISPIKPVRCNVVVLSDEIAGTISVDFIDHAGETISEITVKPLKDSFINWKSILPFERSGDRVIMVDILLLEKLIKAFKGIDREIWLSVPENSAKPIALIGDNSQAILLPIRRSEKEHITLVDFIKMCNIEHLETNN